MKTTNTTILNNLICMITLRQVISCRDILTEKVQKQYWDGTLATKPLPYNNPT